MLQEFSLGGIIFIVMCFAFYTYRIQKFTECRTLEGFTYVLACLPFSDLGTSMKLENWTTFPEIVGVCCCQRVANLHIKQWQRLLSK
jgi:hypothetical protein